MAKPNIGDRHEIQPTDLNYSAAAVGWINRGVTFVHGKASDETAQVKITEVKKRHLHARIKEVISPSPNR